MLKTTDLDFKYPDELVATQAKPRGESRIFFISRNRPFSEELTWARFLANFKAGDTLVLNDSKVIPARLIIKKASGKTGEILFLKRLDDNLHWEVMTGGLNLKEGKVIELPDGVKAHVTQAGRYSQLRIEGLKGTAEEYFEKHGEMPLPPYITKLRAPEAQYEKEDRERYQTAWAKQIGSVAAPTSGLHFKKEHLAALEKAGVKIRYITLHVGAGTFAPIDEESLDNFKIHAEYVDVKQDTCTAVLESRAAGKRVWACGTTVCRALESAVWGSGTAETNNPLIRPFRGETGIFIKPGYKFLAVDALITNFHQPQSSLLALVSAFATSHIVNSVEGHKQAVQKVLDCYQQAIDKKFRLFSYGDMTVLF